MRASLGLTLDAVPRRQRFRTIVGGLRLRHEATGLAGGPPH
jgi:hypothetical protein